MGHGFKGDTGHYHSLWENVTQAANGYLFQGGYFGVSSPDSKERNRNIECADPLEESQKFYDSIALGGIEKILRNGKGVMTELADGAVISYRKVSASDGSPVVEINIRHSRGSDGVKGQKIHFIQRKDG